MEQLERFTDDGIEEIENQSFTDNVTGKTYWIDNGLDEIVELLNWYDKRLKEKDELLKETLRVNEHLSRNLIRLEDELMECRNAKG